jgi:sulfur carrier protein
MAMTLTVNGESLELQGSGDIPSLLDQLGANSERVAVMINDSIVAREAWPTVALADGDHVEVLTFAGGG